MESFGPGSGVVEAETMERDSKHGDSESSDGGRDFQTAFRDETAKGQGPDSASATDNENDEVN
ncbi:hypothetical protein ColKHC_09664 [Colletotrichum higginsianum]|nr:hypothetical protein ColKHC_09664 [Colletotrichum higginsianum]